MVAAADNTQALERLAPAGARAGELSFGQMLARANVLATSGLVAKDLKDNPAACALVGAMGAELGVPFVASLAEIHVIEAKPSPSAQLRLALIRRAGHEAQFVESTPERAVIRGRRRERSNDPAGWTTVEWTVDQARTAGLLDQWVEIWRNTDSGKRWCEKFVLGREGVDVPEWAQKEIRAGKTKQKENWHRYRAEMLRARAASALCRMEFSDVLLGMADYTPEERGVDIGHDVDDQGDDDIVDAELVDEDSQAGESDEAADAAGMPGKATEPPGEVPGQTTPAGAVAEQTPTDQEQEPNGSPAVAAPDGPAPTSWKARAGAAGISNGNLLRQARMYAEKAHVPLPASLDDIDRSEVAVELGAWLDRFAAAPAS